MIFFGTIAIAVLIAFYAEKRDKKSGVFWVIVFLSLLCGLRDISVGTDTIHYRSYLSYISHGEPSFMKDEPLFWYLSKLIMSVLGNYQSVFVFFAFVINLLIISRLWSLRRYGSFSMMVFLYCCIFYAQSFNILRQYVALAIVFFSTKLLEKRKYVLFGIMVVVASLCHMSAWMSIVFIPIHYWINNRGTIKRMAFTTMCLACIPALYTIFISVLESYVHFFTNVEFELSVLLLLRLAILFSYVLLQKHIVFKAAKKDIDKANACKFMVTIYSLSMPLLFIGCFFDQLGRVSQYYLIYELPFMAMVCENNKARKLYKIACIFMALYFIIVKVYINHESGIFPFKMCFM